MQPGDADVVDPDHRRPEELGDQRGLLGDRQIAGPGAHHGDRRGGRPRRGRPEHRDPGELVDGDLGHQRAQRLGPRGVDPGGDRPAGPARQLAHRRGDLLGGLAAAEHDLRDAGAQLAVVVDHRAADGVGDLGVRQIAEPIHGVGRRQRAGAHLVEHVQQLLPIHERFVPC